MAEIRPKHLCVEDHDHQGAIINLMKQYVNWPQTEAAWPVYVEVMGGASNILKRSSLSASLKSPGLQALGIVVDANDSFQSRWGSIRDFCVMHFSAVPTAMPETGLVLSNSDGVRFGAWIMPDNKSRGMIETFCRHMVPTGAEALWGFAAVSYRASRSHGAIWRDVHEEKAHIHTWLAWQDPPGERMGAAITKKILDHTAAACQPFVKWFQDLYQV